MDDSSSARIGFVPAAPYGIAAAPGGAPPTDLAVASAGRADASLLVDVIAGAFLEDPTWSWAFPEPGTRRRWWDFCIHGALRYPWVFKTSGFETVAVWIPPEGSEFSDDEEETIPDLLAELVGPGASAVAELLRRFGEARPREPHYYLSLLGTRDAHRGRGLGMALLKENLARIDREQTPAYLESSNPGNDHRYASLGFEPIVSFRAPGDGPRVTGMWRKKR